jgi:hypothetical protein
MLSRKPDELFGKATPNLLPGGCDDRRRVEVGRMEDKAPCRLMLDVEVEVELLAFRRELEAGKLRGQGSRDVGLDLLLQFLARRGFERRDRRISRTGDKAAFGLGLDAIGEARDDALEFRGAIVAPPLR